MIKYEEICKLYLNPDKYKNKYINKDKVKELYSKWINDIDCFKSDMLRDVEKLLEDKE